MMYETARAYAGLVGEIHAVVVSAALDDAGARAEILRLIGAFRQDRMTDTQLSTHTTDTR